ncbi:Ankyrin [Acidisarcina polymorpha]|uniref:Ankyrin n=1 Tax=Acidisarcina polymorpha TaxID=2211140 RepID=A0A2Z5G843_9BACT|nr:ankyrin repeat domain-containing protein [Acidisarcina polymorpha]AXC15139.1 Ankyrin [Acidisarcina polymorpha]
MSGAIHPLEDLSEAAFIEAACVPLDESHSSGTLEAANAILSNDPEVVTSSIYAAAVVGELAAVQRFLLLNSSLATAKGGPRNWDPLTYLCFSRYLRIDHGRSDSLVRTARALLDAGASPNTGWYQSGHRPTPTWESAIYGAAGIAHHAEMTALLLDRGADPNDGETPYHAAEGYDLSALKVLVESGKLNHDSLTTLLLRKSDWHDLEGIRYLLAHGADPNRREGGHDTALQFALRRDNDIHIIDTLLDHGANTALGSERDGRSSSAIAARKGRGDVLRSIERRGLALGLQGVNELIAVCAKGDATAVQALAARQPQLVPQVIEEGGTLLAGFASNGNVEGSRLLLDLGVEIAARYAEGDNYFDIARQSTALHFAAWRMRHAVVKLLLERGAPVDALDSKGRTPLELAVRACVDSHWAEWRSPESVRMLLDAGASAMKAQYPSGYREIDELLSKLRESLP